MTNHHFLDFQPNEENRLTAKVVLDVWKDFCPKSLVEEGGDFIPGEVEIIVGDSSGIVDEGLGFFHGKPVWVNELSQLTPEKQAAWKYACENQEQVKTAILTALLPMYDKWKDELDGDDFIEMPPIDSIDQFADHLLLNAIYLFDTEKEGISYTGYCFDATWEEEHGLGIVVHKDAIVNIGPMSLAMTNPICTEE